LKGGKYMQTLNLERRLFLFAIVAAMLFTLAPSANVFAGEPPGEFGCEDLRFDAPPYMGILTVTYDEGDILLSGSMSRAGNPGCGGDFFNHLLVSGFVTLPEFQALRPHDLQGLCLANNSVFTCIGDDQLMSVLAVGNMTWIGDYSFSGRFIIIPRDF
jgi:hypothetical protein